jgi:putative transposase
LLVGRTSYYAWLRNREVAEKRKEHLKKRIKEEFAESRGTYGPDRILAELRKTGERLGRVKCRDLMKEMALSSCHNRHKTRSLTNSKKARGDGYPNILRDQEFPIAARMELASDITYLKTGEGFMYHCVIRDIVTGDVLGDHMADRMTKELVINAILGMLARHDLAEGCIFHSDRGSQYTSKAVMGLLQQYGLRQSFSRVGMPGDNAWSESFFATMKKELIHWTHYETKEAVREAVFEYIYCFYNVTRIQRRLGYMSPREYLRSLRTDRLIKVAKQIVYKIVEVPLV